MKNRITELFKIELPIIQAGMIWCSGWELASAVSNAGGLGIIGAGSMYPDVLRSQISKCKKATNKPFAVNLPLLYPSIEEHVQTIIDLKVPIVFTSAGSPSKWTPLFKQHGITVVHVVSNVKFAQKSESSGVDAIVAEGFEAGGHNGREETTTICLIPLLLNNVKIPIIAAGGIGSGSAMAAAFALGAEAVQIGSLFVASPESSAHQSFKNLIVDATDGSTELSLKELTPVRLLKNKFYDDIQTAYNNKASILQLKELLGRGRAKKGMFEGDLIEGELEIGQIASSITQVKPAALIVNEIWTDFKASIKKLGSLTD
ncbi:MAG: nitronate monooxygenase [Flavobacteriales bacterium]|nr:nitronate monooxygenase [Flavobacteriales bacterium]|tara:strand:+ start:4010 stop:4957 length:948 start_codon:yes stop_codon:yes gene_type:complete